MTETFESLTLDILMSELAGEVEPRNSISINNDWRKFYKTK